MALILEFVVQKKGEKEKETIKEEPFAFVIRGPSFFLVSFLSFYLSPSFFFSHSFSLSMCPTINNHNINKWNK
jgi:hypothetical protein